MAYVGDKLPLMRNDKLSVQPESVYGQDPGVITQDNIVPFESGSITETPEQIRQETVRESRTMNRKDNTIWTSEGEAECLYRGGGTNGADTGGGATAADARPEGIHHLIKAHIGTDAELAAVTTVAGSTATQIKLDTGGGTGRERGDLITWYDATLGKLLSRFVVSVSGDDVNVWPPLDGGDVPGAGEYVYGQVQLRQAGTKTQHPSLYVKHWDGDEIVRGFGGVLVPTMGIEVPLAEYASFSFTLNGLRGADPAAGSIPGGVYAPRNPNFPALGLDAFMMYYSYGREGHAGGVFPVTPLSLSVESTYELATITALDSVNTPKRLRLGMREVTATLEVLYDDVEIVDDFRNADRISLIAVVGRNSYSVNAGWQPKSYNAFVLGLPQMSIDTLDMPEHEDTKKLTLGLTAEPVQYNVETQMFFDEEFTMAFLGEAG